LYRKTQTDKLFWDVSINFDSIAGANRFGTLTAETDIDRIKHSNNLKRNIKAHRFVFTAFIRREQNRTEQNKTTQTKTTYNTTVTNKRKLY
jgi:hypothetical protein